MGILFSCPTINECNNYKGEHRQKDNLFMLTGSYFIFYLALSCGFVYVTCIHLHSLERGIFGGLDNLCYTVADVASPLLHCIVHFEPIHVLVLQLGHGVF